MSRPSAPPRLAEWLLATMLGPSEWCETILGDLHEEYVRVCSARSPRRAMLWYWHEALRIASRSALRTARRTPNRPATDTPTHDSPRRGDSVTRTLALETRYALRSLRKRPAMTVTVMLTLALGLGANASIFAIIDALVLRPFPFADVDRLAMVTEIPPGGSLDRQESVSPGNFLDLKRQTDVFQYFAAFEWWDANLVGRGEPERVQGFHVSADFFPALAIQPILGRGFAPDDEVWGRHRVAIIGHGLWQRRFAGNPAVIGQAINLDGQQHEVVGIAPEGFDFPSGCEIWAPLAFTTDRAAVRNIRPLTPIARLAPGRTIADADAQVSVIGARLATQYPEANRGRTMRVYTLARGMLDPGLGPILSLWQASGLFVLLIACANIANLLLARGTEREREMAVRLAIGASRIRVVRELLIESGILALASVPAALAVAFAALNIVRGYMPSNIARFVPGWQTIDVDGRLVLFMVALALGAAILFGLLPALQTSRPRLANALKDGGRGATGTGPQRIRRILVVAEMALALPLLVVTGLSVTGVHRFLNGPQGYDPDGTLIMQVVLPEAGYPDAGSRRRFTTALLDRLHATPGVSAAAAMNIAPAIGPNSSRGIEIEGTPNVDPANPPSVDYRVVTPRVFETLGIPLVRGRIFTDADRDDTQAIAIVSESLARTYFPGKDPIGRRLRITNGEWLTIVGLCGDIIHNWFMRRNYPTMYRPFAQAPRDDMVVAVRTATDPAALATAARLAVYAVDPAQPVFNVRTMRDQLKERTVGLQYMAGVMGGFGLLALLLAIVGVYGVMTFLVSQRTQEIGVRMALGATRRDVLQLTVGQAGRLTVIGVVLGAALSMALGRLMEAGLLGSAANDGRLVLLFGAVLVAASLAAGYIPARRAAGIDPIVALRSE